VVTPADASALLTIDATDRKALCTGLAFAALLGRHFPGFYQEHIAARKISYSTLLGVAGAFLSLAHTQLLALDADRVGGLLLAPKDPTEPLKICGGYYDSSYAKNDLSNAAAAWLFTPRPRVYGLGMEVVAPDNAHRHWPPKPSAIERHALALLIWRLFSDTRWSVLGDAQVAELAMARVGKIDLARQIATTRPLLRETPLRALCLQLDADPPAGMNQLGTIIAYACRRTGNAYADTSQAEVRQQQDNLIIDLDWHRSAAHFARERDDQQVAGKWAGAYSRLAGRLWKTPALLADQLIVAVAAAALAVREHDDDTDTTSPYDPRPLINRLHEVRTR